jgi:5-methylcytosine-specific restriction endonuclease McrA
LKSIQKTIHRRDYLNNYKSSNLNFHYLTTRDFEGNIILSSKAKAEFLRRKGYEKVPEGTEVDHIIPLYAGGRDCPENMQIISSAARKAKTKQDYARYGS